MAHSTTGYTTNLPLDGRHRRQGLGRLGVRRQAAADRARRPGAAAGAAPVLLEVRQVGHPARADGPRPAGVLGAERLPRPRRPVARAALPGRPVSALPAATASQATLDHRPGRRGRPARRPPGAAAARRRGARRHLPGPALRRAAARAGRLHRAALLLHRVRPRRPAAGADGRVPARRRGLGLPARRGRVGDVLEMRGPSGAGSSGPATSLRLAIAGGSGVVPLDLHAAVRRAAGARAPAPRSSPWVGRWTSCPTPDELLDGGAFVALTRENLGSRVAAPPYLSEVQPLTAGVERAYVCGSVGFASFAERLLGEAGVRVGRRPRRAVRRHRMTAPATRPSVVLVTASLFADGEIGGDLVAALDRVGVDARWEVWDDEGVDWAADLVAVRSAWDYHRRCPEFLAWAQRVERISPLLNGAELSSPGTPTRPTSSSSPSTCPSYPPGGWTSRHWRAVSPPAWRSSARSSSSRGSAPAAWASWSSRSSWTRGCRDWSPGRGSCSRWSTPCEPRARRRSTSSPAARSRRSTSAPGGAEEVRVHEVYGGSSRAVKLGKGTAALAERAVAGRRAGARHRHRLRPGRPDDLAGQAGRQRARAHRAGPLPRCRPRQRRPLRRAGGVVPGRSAGRHLPVARQHRDVDASRSRGTSARSRC